MKERVFNFSAGPAVLPDEVPSSEDGKPKQKRKGRISQILSSVRKKKSSGIRVQDVEDMLVRFAHCCNPVPGEAIVGFITRGRGVSNERASSICVLDSLGVG